MTETAPHQLSSPEPSPLTGRETVPAAAPARSLALPVLYFVGFAVLAGAIAWMWQNPPQASDSQTAGLQERLDRVEARLARLEAQSMPRPAPIAAPVAAPAPVFDPAPLIKRLAALEAQPAAAPTTASTVPMPPPPDLAPLESRIATLEARPATPPVDAALTQRIGRIAMIQAASAALEAGHRLGKITDAPPALQRFADVDPPTEASLRLAFPAAAHAALVASRPIDPELPALSRIWGRLQELITIRQGERVLIGDPAAGVVATARQALDAGDLAGAVSALDRLNPPAAQAMSGWIASAKALLEARAAQADMAARAAAAAHG